MRNIVNAAKALGVNNIADLHNIVDTQTISTE